MRTRSEILDAFGRAGVARTCDLHARGVGQHDLRRMLRDGAIVRVRQGVYARAGIRPDVRTAAEHGGMLACVSAARAAGLWVLEEDRLHVAVGRRDRVHRHAGCRCRTHRVSGVVFGRRTGIVRTLIQILACQGEEGFFVTLESALRHRVLDARGRAILRRLLPERARRLLDIARDDADSGIESLLRLRLIPYGIELASQVEVPGVGTVDFVLGDRLILEVDGKLNHDGPSERHRDLVRDAVAAGLGFDTLRFDYALIVHDWETVLAAILSKVDRGLHLTRR